MCVVVAFAKDLDQQTRFSGLAAVAFMTICVATLVYRPHKIYAEMFVVPVGSLFAFTSIRANLPGAPTGFGGYQLLDSAVINKSGQVLQ